MRLAVVGRGIAALAVTDAAARRSASVTLYGPPRGDGVASYAAQGFSLHKGLLLPESAFFRDKMQGQKSLWQWLERTEAQSGQTIPRVKGVFEPYWGPDEYTKIVKRVYRGDFTGLFQVEHGVPRREWDGLFATPPLGALFYPEDFWFDPRTFLDVLEGTLTRTGVAIISRTVPELGSLSAYDAVIVAAGAGTNALLQSAGLMPLPMREVPGTVFEPAFPTETAMALTRFGTGALLAPTARIPLVKDTGASLNGALDYFHLEAAGVPSEYLRVTGVRMRTRDKAPHVGAYGRPGLFVLSGLGRNGMELAPVYAPRLVDEILKADR